MTDLLVQFVSRLAVMLPTIALLAAVLWLIFNRRHFAAAAASFSSSDLPTWPLRFAVLDGCVFAIVFAIVSALMADSQFGAGVAGGLAAIVAIGVVPWLANRSPRLSQWMSMPIASRFAEVWPMAGRA